MRKVKSLKFTNEFKGIGPKLKWFLFTQLQDLKITSDYINMICPASDCGKINENSNPLEDLEKMVRESLIREFSPEIQNMKSYELLVDAVMYNVQKKSLQTSSRGALSNSREKV